MTRDEPLPLRHLRAVAARHGPDVWNRVEAVRQLLAGAAPRRDVYVTTSEVAVALLGGAVQALRDPSAVDLRDEVVVEAARVAALAGWRMGKGIYRYDPDLARALASTPAASVPADALRRLPEWCIYVDPGAPDVLLPWATEAPIVGAYVRLDRAANGREWLQVLLATADPPPDDLQPLMVELPAGGDVSVADLARQAVEEAQRDAPEGAMQGPEEVAALLGRLLPLVLYLSAQGADVVGPAPENPAPVRVRGGMRLFARDAVREWQVGWRIGPVLRAAAAGPRHEERGGHHATPRPHLRRAHWHHYWVGPHAGPGRRLVLRWVHPVLVGAHTDAMPAVVRRVKGGAEDAR